MKRKYRKFVGRALRPRHWFEMKRKYRKFVGRALCPRHWFGSYKLNPAEVFLVNEWLEREGGLWF